MGKIKGWKKIEDTKFRLRYGNGELRKIPYTRGLHSENWITLVDKTVFHSGKKRQGDRDFKTKTDARNYMIAFMKSHPRG